MDSRLNTVLIGYGQIGKKFFKEIEKNHNFNLIYIVRQNLKKKIKNKKIISIKNFKKLKKKIDFAVVATPLETHYFYANLLIKKKIPFILEKPACANLIKIKKIYQNSRLNNTSVFVNHSDTFNSDFKKILNKINKNKIKKIKFIFGAKQLKKYKFF